MRESAPGRGIGSGVGTRSADRTLHAPCLRVGPLFRHRFERIYECRIDYDLDVNNRATMRVLGGYYKLRRLIRIYARDRELGLRPVEELSTRFSTRWPIISSTPSPFRSRPGRVDACPAGCIAGFSGRSSES